MDLTLIPLLHRPDPATDARWLPVQRALAADALETRAALRALGHDGDLPPTVLVDGAEADRLRIEPGGVAARRLCPHLVGTIAAFVGTGDVQGPVVLEQWLDSGLCCAPGTRLASLVREATGVDLDSEAPIVVVDVTAASRLTRAVHGLGHGSGARLRNLITLAWQREVLRWLSRSLDPKTSADLSLIPRTHAALLGQQPKLRRLRALQRWLTKLTSPARKMILPPGAGLLSDLDDRCPAEAPWSTLWTALESAGLQTYTVKGSLPTSPDDMDVGFDPRLAELWPERLDEPGFVPPWRRGDWLGEFRTRGHRPGIHLYCRRIGNSASRSKVPSSDLAWMVLWHELTHWRLRQDGNVGRPLVRLRAVDVEEVVCELLAERAVARGEAPFVLQGLAAPPRATHGLRRWRNRQLCYPYSWFPRLVLPCGGLTDEQLRGFALRSIRALREVETSWVVGEEPPREAEELLAALLPLLSGVMPLRPAHDLVVRLAGEWRAPPRAVRPPAVYFWMGDE